MEKNAQFVKYYEGNEKPFITIEGIFSLLEDEEIFNKFMNYEDYEQFFGEIPQKVVARVVNNYMQLILNQGAILGDAETGRLRAIEQMVPKYYLIEPSDFNNYSGINKKELYDVAIGILSSKTEFDRFLQCQQKSIPYNNYSTELLTDYILKELAESIKSVAIAEMVPKALDFIKQKEELLPIDSYKVDATKKLDSAFEAALYQTVDADDNPLDMGLKIYNILNRNVRYDNTFSALDQDYKNNPIARRIYSKDISEITLLDNTVTCKHWAELYAYLLQKKDYDAYVCGSNRHNWVVAFKGTNIIYADGTEPTQQLEENATMCDITRSKLGVRPANFIAYDFDGMSNITESIALADFCYDSDEANKSKDVLSEINALISQIRDNKNLSQSIGGENSDNRFLNIMKKIGYINFMVHKTKLDNTDCVSYIHNLLNNCLAFSERELVEWVNCFYQGINTNNCNMVPIIAIKNEGNQTNSAEEYTYLIFDQELYSLVPITSSELKRSVISGKYIQGIGKYDNAVVPGISEITDPDWVTRSRAAKILPKFRENIGRTVE